MSSDTTRPNVPEELDERLAAATTEHVRIPADRLTFADRLEVLLEEYHDATERVESLESELERRDQRIDELEEALAEARSQGGVLST